MRLFWGRSLLREDPRDIKIGLVRLQARGGGAIRVELAPQFRDDLVQTFKKLCLGRNLGLGRLN